MNPDEFYCKMQELIRNLQGPDLHQAVDQLMCEVMRNQGYGEGVDAFIRAVEGYHS